MLDIWPSLKISPIITEFGWSPLIESAFDTNRDVISPVLQFYPSVSNSTSLQASERYPVIPGLLVLHVRRGDYEDHCKFLEKTQSSWHAFTSLPGIVERFDAPPSSNTREHKEWYWKHCYPSIEDMAEKVLAIRQSPAGRNLKDIYIMTNAHVPWLEELKQALDFIGEWRSITASRDLQLDWEQKYVSQAVDMLIAQRAEFIIGNAVCCRLCPTHLYATHSFFSVVISDGNYRNATHRARWKPRAH